MKAIGVIIVYMLLMTGIMSGQENYVSQRKTMVELQIKARGVQHYATLGAMLNVPRHEFVPDEMKPYAYSDRPLPIGQGQTISQPFIVAFMTQALKPKSTDRVLEIGTGSGYQAAVLGKIVDSVYTIEIVKDLAGAATDKLQQLNYSNVIVKSGDGYYGWPSKAPFDAIMVTAGADSIPQPLVNQLKIGGRMIIPVGPHHGVRQLILLTKKKNKIIKKNLMAVRFVPFTRSKN